MEENKKLQYKLIEGVICAIYASGIIKPKKLLNYRGRIYLNMNGTMKRADHFIWEAKGRKLNPNKDLSYKDGDFNNLSIDNLIEIPRTGKVFKEVQQVCQYTGRVIDTFYSLTNASKTTGVRQSCIYNVITGRHSTAGGFEWVGIKHLIDKNQRL